MTTAEEHKQRVSYFDQAKSAVVNGDVTGLKKLLDEHLAEINAETELINNAWHRGGVNALLSKAIRNEDVPGHRGFTSRIYPEIVQCLIDHGAASEAKVSSSLLHTLFNRYIPYYGNHRAGDKFEGYRTPSAKVVIDIAQRLINAGADLNQQGNDPSFNPLQMAYATHDIDIIRFMEDVYKAKGVEVSFGKKVTAFYEAKRVNMEYPHAPDREVAVIKYLQSQVTADPQLQKYEGTFPIKHHPRHYKDEPSPSDLEMHTEGQPINHATLKLASTAASFNTYNTTHGIRIGLEDQRKKAELPNSPHYYQYRRDEEDTEFHARQDYLAQVRDAIAQLPGQKKRFELMNAKEEFAFEQMLGLAYMMAQGVNPHIPHMPPDLVIGLLANEKEDWSKAYENLPADAASSARHAKDAFLGITRALVLPEMLRQLKLKRIRIESLDVEKLEGLIASEVVEVLSKNRTLKTMLALGDEWHAQLARIESARKFERSGSWPTLTQDFTASNGCTLHFMSSANEVKEYVEKIDIGVEERRRCCAMSKVESFKAGNLHIAAVSDANGRPLSTLGLTQDTKLVLRIDQNVAPGNKELEDTHPAHVAVTEFLAKVRLAKEEPGKIHIDFDKLDAERRRRIDIAQTPYLDLIGHDPFAPDAATYEKKYLDGYANIRLRTGAKPSFIPGHGNTAADYTAQDFLKDTGLMKMIEECASNRTLQRSITRHGIGI